MTTQTNDQVFQTGTTGRFKVTIVKLDGTIITGLFPTVYIQRISDNFEFDYSSLSFVPNGTAINHDTPCIEDLPSEPGTYYFDFNQSAYDGTGDNEYLAIYTASPTYTDKANEVYQFIFIGAVCTFNAELIEKFQLIANMIAISSPSTTLNLVGSLSGTLINILPLACILNEKHQLNGEIINKSYMQAELVNVLQLTN